MAREAKLFWSASVLMMAITLDATDITDEVSQSDYRFADAGGPDTLKFGSINLSRTVALGVRYSFP